MPGVSKCLTRAVRSISRLDYNRIQAIMHQTSAGRHAGARGFRTGRLRETQMPPLALPQAAHTALRSSAGSRNEASRPFYDPFRHRSPTDLRDLAWWNVALEMHGPTLNA